MPWSTFLSEALACHPERDREPHRRSEVIASQGQPHNPGSVRLAGGSPLRVRGLRDHVPGSSVSASNEAGVRPRRDSSPLPSSFHSRQGFGTRSSRTSFSQDAFAEYVATTPAAVDKEKPGRGLYISMQRGLASAHSSAQKGSGSEDAPVKGSSYRAHDDDVVDQCLERYLRRLPAAGAIQVRRIAPAEYEVNGVRLRILFRADDPSRSPEAFVTRAGEPMESLMTYLRRAAEACRIQQVVHPGCFALHAADARSSNNSVCAVSVTPSATSRYVRAPKPAPPQSTSPKCAASKMVHAQWMASSSMPSPQTFTPAQYVTVRV